MRGISASANKAKLVGSLLYTLFTPLTLNRDQAFERELSVWANLNHPRILPFLGIVTDIGPFISLVSLNLIRDTTILNVWLGFFMARTWEYQEVRVSF